MSNPWRKEFWRVVLGSLIAVMFGMIIGHVLVVLLIAAIAYSAWHLYRLYQLDRSFHEGKTHKFPDVGGVWGEVYYHIHRLQKRNRERKKRLTRMLSRFKESTSALPDGTVVLSKNWEIEWYNDAAKELLGLHAKNDVGQRIDNLIRDPGFISYISKGDFSGPLELLSPVNPQLKLTIRIIPYARNQQLMVARDVTNIYHLEQMRRDFVANVSHELRTPLTVVNGYLEAMADNDDESLRPWQRSIAQMSQQVQRMDNIVEDLLLLSRLETADHIQLEENVSVPDLLVSIKHDAIALSGERQHDIRLEVDETLYISGDGKELRSAFANLVFNAVRYSPDKGEIKIRWYQNSEGAHFEVSDNGRGIPPHHIPRLTERFYRIDAGRSRTTGGTGLGLAIVKHVLMRHDASLRIDSTLGKGSIFSCDFPVKRIVSEVMEEKSRMS